jgi:hypothetical protein
MWLLTMRAGGQGCGYGILPRVVPRFKRSSTVAWSFSSRGVRTAIASAGSIATHCRRQSRKQCYASELRHCDVRSATNRIIGSIGGPRWSRSRLIHGFNSSSCNQGLPRGGASLSLVPGVWASGVAGITAAMAGYRTWVQRDKDSGMIGGRIGASAGGQSQ